MHLIVIIALFFSLTTYAQNNLKVTIVDPNKTILPDQFIIYTNGFATINHPAPGYTPKILPTINDYKGVPGCYILCHSYNPEQSIFSITPDIYVKGQIRVQGRYYYRTCQPTGFASADISKEQYFKNLCQDKIKGCERGDCWASGETGNWTSILVKQ